jgi:hypothetical protein
VTRITHTDCGTFGRLRTRAHYPRYNPGVNGIDRVGLSLPTRNRTIARHLATSLLAFSITACGGGIDRGSGALAPNTISVFLPVATVELSAGGAEVTIPILIDSPGETALVEVDGLPAGVQVAYAASDTNPSGTLAFLANNQAMSGSRMPIVKVTSIGQMVTAALTVVVK